MYSFVCPDCRAGEHEKCPNGTWCDCLHRPRKDGHSYGRMYMLKRLGAGVAVLAITALTLLAAPAAAQAATPQQFVPYEVSFTPEKPACDGVVKVATTNNLDERFHIGLTFKVNATFVNVDPESTVITLVSYPDSKNIDVKLVGLYDASEDDDPVLTEKVATERSDVAFTELQKEWNYQWERPDGCWDIKVLSLCGGGLGLTAKNTSPAPGEIIIQPDTTDAVEVMVEGNKTFTATYPVTTLSISVDGKLTTYNFVQPVCASPSPPAVNAPPVGRDTSNDLPATGSQAAASDLRWGTIALGVALTGAAAIGVLWFVRRSRRQTSPQS